MHTLSIRKNWKLLMILGFLLILIAFCLCFRPGTYSIASGEIAILSPIECSANHMQYEASVYMFIHNGQLCFSPTRSSDAYGNTKYHTGIHVFQHGTIRQLVKTDSRLLATCNGYAYFKKSCGEYSELYSHNLHTQEEKCVLTVSDHYDRANYQKDNTFYFSSSHYSGEVYPIQDGNVGSPLNQGASYTLNGITYTILSASTYATDIVQARDASGNVWEMVDEFDTGKKTLIPCENGILVHNEGYESLLYLIQKDTNEVIEVFSISCAASKSAVTVYGHYAYLSLDRYTSFGTMGNPLRQKDDTVPGTYRIDLNTMEATKINDTFYDGLYIFDTTGIYACDSNCNIYKLDFNGELTSVLLEYSEPVWRSVFKWATYGTLLGAQI